MNPSLTTRLKENLQFIDDRKKFLFCEDSLGWDLIWVDESGNQHRLISFTDLNPISINPDPKREFSNSLGRIVWEAFGDRILLESNIQKNGELKYHIHLLNKHNQCSFGIDLHSTTELSAQIEAVCIRIEQEREKP